MKTIIAIIFVSFLTMALHAHDGFLPFVVEGKVWNYEYVVPQTGEKYIYQMYFEGDTVISGHTCKRLYEKRPSKEPYCYGGCYEDADGKVWMCYGPGEMSQPRLLCDFGCKEGETLTNLVTYTQAAVKVVKVETVESFGQKRRLITLSKAPTYSAWPADTISYWLEGIGNPREMFDPWLHTVWNRFVSCEQNGAIIADQSSFNRNTTETDRWSFDDTLEWRYGLFLINPEGQESYYTDGKVEKNGKVYHRLRMSRGFIAGYPYGYPWFYRPPARGSYSDTLSVAVRNVGGRIYVDKDDYMRLLEPRCFWSSLGDSTNIPYEQTADGELILYDFNKQVGEVYCKTAGLGDITVTQVDTIVGEYTDGASRRQLTLSNGLKILEDVGSILSRGMFLFYLNPGDNPIKFAWLNAVSYKDAESTDYPNNYLFHGDILYLQDALDAYHRTGITERNSSSLPGNSIYDLQGRRLAAPPAKGIYVKDGRKVVVR